MKCQDCGSNDAFVHLTEVRDGEVSSFWICSDCSLKRQEVRKPLSTGHPLQDDDSEILASFLGDDFTHPVETLNSTLVKVCPSCDYTLAKWKKSNLLGCSRCYQAFSWAITPQLARFHGHATHLGRFPSHHLKGADQLAAIKRVRVALDKAVSREDFEEAARQRDLLRTLKEGGREEQ